MNLKSAKLHDLILLLENPKLTHQEREAIKKAILRLDALRPLTGATLIDSTTIYNWLWWDIIRYDAGGEHIEFYDATEDGMNEANSDAASGDVLQIPARTIPGNHSITAGVSVVGVSRFGSIFSGQLTLGAGSYLENLSVTRTSNAGNDLICVVGPGSGTAELNHVHASATNSGAGNAYGLSATGGGDVKTWGCYLYGSSGSGNGYGTYRTSGSIYNFGGGHIDGSTGPCNE